MNSEAKELETSTDEAAPVEPVVMWGIWMEGYLCTGMEGVPATASYEGQWPGETFKDACQAWCDADADRKKYFNADRLTYWGCGLYDNEEEARKMFG